MASPAPNILVFGGIVTDLVTVLERLPDSGETLTSTSFSTHAGGKGANSSVAAARLSRANPDGARASTGPEITVRMIGAVGDDEFGPQRKADLERSGVDASRVDVVAGQKTGVCVIIVESDSGENRIMYNPGANHTLLPTQFTTFESLCGATRPDLLISQLEIRRDTIEQVLEVASEGGVDILLNPSPAHILLSHVYKMITHLIINETEAAMLSGRGMEEMTTVSDWANVTDEFLKMGVKNVVVTLGAKGAYYSNSIGNGGSVDAEKNIKVVDTTGAGDTFVGAYAVEFVKQKQQGIWNIEQAVRFACKASARTIEHLGAQEAIPWADQVDPIESEQAKVKPVEVESAVVEPIAV
ncbi:hypothetical protein MMC17_004507 [Xylographa soralifera]|nr:hypothetical protein [Xylographa soralifera]